VTQLSYLSFNKVDFSAAIPYMLAQLLGGAIAGKVIDLQLSPKIQASLE
jgi:glycerol uptake facilitator-like aquaporin